ncbi:hypothetical protein [Enterocloster citroniae]|uniref:Uncharacterized protein n=1 Tax=[Clostridium] citroniae WAL-17108 TaxID=742733 RepID=G5HER2_9FIRM|nr:hypothetical protein [Enterocloster citroniae]EHF00021.1 hypothetical protein HMPREF9469_00935 [ [[Clostridium] citroniae WAL-17108]MCC3383280.1 hypothetical protein [Enterocloster citroniae]DAT42510.1 MAG TPA: hypothetical protein [Caudoviricetes sp.]
MEKMLVTQALNELKLLDGRINRAISNGEYVAAARLNESKVSSTVTKEEFISNAKSSLQSVNDLIERRKKIKAAVVISNANTFVDISGVSMTVADAIERKDSIEYDEEILGTLKKQLSNARATVGQKNLNMELQIDKIVESSFGKDSRQKINSDDYEAIAKPYRTNNEYGLVDPLGIEKLIAQMEEAIQGFISNVDAALQISNCTTYIEF